MGAEGKGDGRLSEICAPDMPQPVYVMTVNQRRYGFLCAKCGQRVRAGKKFVIDQLEPEKIRHQKCAEKPKP